VTAVHHFVATYEPGAIGGHIVEMQRLCRELGWDSEVYTEHLRGLPGRDYREYPKQARPDDVLVYHTAIGSPVADFVAGRPERLVVNHHNLTPTTFFAAWEPAVVHGLAWGRAQMGGLAARAELGIADSSFNEAELHELGFARTCVVPILFDLAQLDREAVPGLADRLRAEGRSWLFVGRIAPNKCHHDLIKAFAVYRRTYDGGARLRIVGGSASDRYVDALRSLVSALQLDDAVTFTGAVGDGELAAHYDAADAYVCVSEHEGFCVPLLEAMHHDVPVVAYGAGAIPETLGAGGLCLPSKEPTKVAAAVHRVLDDAALRDALVVAGRTQLAAFGLDRTRARMAETLRAFVGA
jgi:glycosyltransferase involved in cell wall biosynthesis